MKTILIATVSALAFASWNVLAVEEHHPEQAQAAAAPAPDTGKTVQKMQDNMMAGKGMMDCPMMQGGMMVGSMGMGMMGGPGGGPGMAPDVMLNRMQMMMENMSRLQGQAMPAK